jgi:hypothetical protein
MARRAAVPITASVALHCNNMNKHALCSIYSGYIPSRIQFPQDIFFSVECHSEVRRNLQLVGYSEFTWPRKKKPFTLQEFLDQDPA